MRIAGQLLRSWGPDSVATPVLAIVDLADGTGATATITGATSDSRIEVFVIAVDDQFGMHSAPVSAGTRTGNGSLHLEIATGLYWAYCVSTLGGGVATSNLVYLFVTSGDEGLQQRILTAVQSRIRSLSLASLPSDQVVIRPKPWDRNLIKPCCVVSPAPERIEPAEATNLRDHIGYGVLVTFGKATHENLADSRDELFQWRRRSVAAFRNQRLPGVPEVYRCTIEPQAVIEPEAFERGMDISGFIVRCLAYETRGL